MSEEKKAIEDLKELKIGIGILNSFIDKKYRDEIDIKAIDIVLNLIEKLQKELEQEKEKNNILEQEKEYLNCIIESDKNNYINKDKIRAKIEELEGQEDWYIENKCLDDLYGRINELKELLEE